MRRGLSAWPLKLPPGLVICHAVYLREGEVSTRLRMVYDSADVYCSEKILVLERTDVEPKRTDTAKDIKWTSDSGESA